VLEAARDGKSVADIMGMGTPILTRHDVMDGVAEMIHEVQVEATFPTARSLSPYTTRFNRRSMHPGEYILDDGKWN